MVICYCLFLQQIVTSKHPSWNDKIACMIIMNPVVWSFCNQFTGHEWLYVEIGMKLLFDFDEDWYEAFGYVWFWWFDLYFGFGFEFMICLCLINLIWFDLICIVFDDDIEQIIEVRVWWRRWGYFGHLLSHAFHVRWFNELFNES